MSVWWRSGAALAVLAAMAGPAMAQSRSAEDETITVVGSRPAYGQQDIASATKTPTPLADVPQSVSVITNDLIEDQAMRSMADVVRYAPGVTMGQGEGHRDAPTLRGNASTADFFVDGVRDDVQYYRDLYNAERIEVLKGPNAMIFGRGGGGGVINRVTEWADWAPTRELSLQGDTYGQARAGLDLGAVFGDGVAARLNAFYEDAESYRDYVNLERFGVNPTAALRLSDATQLRLGYEYFSDDRIVDRGVPSQNGRPFDASRSAFFGNPEQSYAEAEVNIASATLEHAFAANVRLRSHLTLSDYQKYYQNVHANSAVNAAGDVSLQAYDSSTDRFNAFSQTDLIWEVSTGAIAHTILAGLEVGRQQTDNTRSPNNNAAGIVNVAAPTTFAPAAILGPLQSDNHVDVEVLAFYLQDQIELTPRLQLIAGLRFDRFDLAFDDRRAANADFERRDEFFSPRFGVIYKPVEQLSIYGGYSVSYLPQSGDQFGALNAVSSELDPEEFENTEIGLKWDILPELAFTAALYRLDRTNTTAIEPGSGQTVLTGAQRSEGFELGLAGAINERWEIYGGYAYQDVAITRSTTAAPAGRVAPLTPEHAFSLWNNYSLTPRLSAGLGIIHQSSSFASISNAVTLPSFTRLDAALQIALTERIEAQLNVENLLNETYWATAHNDNNITPGSPTAVRFSLRTRF